MTQKLTQYEWVLKFLQDNNGEGTYAELSYWKFSHSVLGNRLERNLRQLAEQQHLMDLYMPGYEVICIKPNEINEVQRQIHHMKKKSLVLFALRRIAPVEPQAQLFDKQCG
jgi:hypothetical protein